MLKDFPINENITLAVEVMNTPTQLSKGLHLEFTWRFHRNSTPVTLFCQFLLFTQLIPQKRSFFCPVRFSYASVMQQKAKPSFLLRADEQLNQKKKKRKKHKQLKGLGCILQDRQSEDTAMSLSSPGFREQHAVTLSSRGRIKRFKNC